jgi:hypothetical protein
MNENNRHDPEMLTRIEALLSSGVASEIPAADQLAHTIPQANPDFQRTLEERLIEQLKVNLTGTGETDMAALTPTADHLTARKSLSYMPLTLAAAMLVIAVVGSILLIQRGKFPDTNTVVMLQAQPTPTPQNYINVVVAYQDLPRGYQFPKNLQKLADVVGYAPMPESVLPIDTLRESENGLNSLLGQVLKSDVFRQQAITAGVLAQDVTQLDNPTNFVMQPPPGRVSTSITLDLEEVLNSDLRRGDWVDLVASLLFADVDDEFQFISPDDTSMQISSAPPANAINLGNINVKNCAIDTPCSMTQTLVNNALILDISNPNNEDGSVMVTLAVQPDELPVVTWTLQANLPYILRPATPEIAQLPAYPGQIPFEMWLGDFNDDSIISDLSKLQQGDLVDVTFSFLLQAPEPQQSNTLQPENGWVITRMILSGIKLYKLGEGFNHPGEAATLLLTREDGTLLTALRNSTLPYAITITPSNAFDIPYRKLSDTQVSIDVPISAFADVSAGTDGTPVDIVVNLDFTTADTSTTDEASNTLLAVQRLAHNAQLLSWPNPQDAGDGEARATIALSQDDLPAVQWAIKAGLPLSLAPST